MLKAAVIGPSESVKGFAALGLQVFAMDDPNEVVRTVSAIADQDKYGVIYITEGLYSRIESRLEIFQERLIPAIIPIPGVSGNTGVGMQNVSRSVEKAVGSDIIQ